MVQAQPVITLKNVKHAEFNSQETECFQATVYKDGKRWCTAENEGHGGCTNFSPLSGNKNKNLYAEIEDFNGNAEFLETEISGKPFKYKNDLESVVGTLLEEWLKLKDLKRILKKAVAYNPEDNNIYSWKTPFSPKFKGMVNQQKPDYVFLNDLPLAEAMEYYKKSGQS